MPVPVPSSCRGPLRRPGLALLCACATVALLLPPGAPASTPRVTANFGDAYSAPDRRARGNRPAGRQKAGQVPRPFAPTSFWNAHLGARASLAPSSEALVADLVGQVDRYGPWINSVRYSTPVYVVPRHQPRVEVTLDQDSWRLRNALQSVPVPARARPGVGTQAHMVVWQPATDTMWELWKASRQGDGWHAQWGGRMEGISRNPGYFREKNWGATATGLPLVGGLITLDEMRRGRIDHALALAVPRVRRSVFSWPAQRTDGQVDSPAAIPHGTRFRLDPRLDLAKLGLPRVTRMLAEAAQRYGIVLRDKAGAVTFYAEDPAQYRIGDPYPALYGHVSPSQLTRRFPWQHLQALAPRPRP